MKYSHLQYSHLQYNTIQYNRGHELKALGLPDNDNAIAQSYIESLTPSSMLSQATPIYPDGSNMGCEEYKDKWLLPKEYR